MNPPIRRIIWLTGQSGAGKTTLARALKGKMQEAVILDGDEMRESISLGAGFDRDAREEHNLRVARLALVLAKQSPVIVAVIAPFATTRAKIDSMINPLWVHVKRADAQGNAEHPYEIPEHPHVVADCDIRTPEGNADFIIAQASSFTILTEGGTAR